MLVAAGKRRGAGCPDSALTLNAGVLAHTNGISLLTDHGFGEGIERNAARVCAWLGAREVEEGDALAWGGCV